jgi:hypothetical protein
MEKSIAHRMNKISASSSSSDSNDHVLLSTDQEQTPETQASTPNATSSSVMPPLQKGSFHSRIYLLGVLDSVKE